MMELKSNWKDYRSPVIGAVIVAFISVLLILHGIYVVADQSENTLRRYALRMSKTIDRLIPDKKQLSNTQSDELTSYFETLVRKTPHLQYIALLVDGEKICFSGPVTENLIIEKTFGQSNHRGTLVLWRMVGESMESPSRNLQHRPHGRGPSFFTDSPPQFNRPPHGEFAPPPPPGADRQIYRWQGDKEPDELKKGDMVLVFGLKLGHGRQASGPLINDLLARFFVMILVSGGLLLAWAQGIRSRIILGQLEIARAEKEKSEAISLTAAGLAHETKNPLGIILGLAQRIAKSPDTSPESRRMAELIQDASDTAAARLGVFLKYSRLQKPDLQFHDGTSLVEDATDALAPHFESSSIKLVIEAKPLLVKCDSEMFTQILVNFLLNSLQASTEGDTVRVILDTDHNKGQLRVIDKGSGVEEEFQKEVFKPYVTAKSSGTGMGLAICKRISDLHHWEIGIQSQVGAGTEISLKNIDVKIKKEEL